MRMSEKCAGRLFHPDKACMGPQLGSLSGAVKRGGRVKKVNHDLISYFEKIKKFIPALITCFFYFRNT